MYVQMSVQVFLIKDDGSFIESTPSTLNCHIHMFSAFPRFLEGLQMFLSNSKFQAVFEEIQVKEKQMFRSGLMDGYTMVHKNRQGVLITFTFLCLPLIGGSLREEVVAVLRLLLASHEFATDTRGPLVDIFFYVKVPA